eukprot:4610766-Ditylum_brightwellii.AAC.1
MSSEPITSYDQWTVDTKSSPWTPPTNLTQSHVVVSNPAFCITSHESVGYVMGDLAMGHRGNCFTPLNP